MLQKRSYLLSVILGVSIIVVVVIVGLTLSGPAIGNIFSDVNSAFTSDMRIADTSTVSLGYEAKTQLTQGIETDGLLANQNEQTRIILKNASLSLTTEDPENALNSVITLAESLGGWVVNSSTSQFVNSAGEQATRGTITIRIPADQLNAVLEQLRGLAINVNAESLSGQDVTTQYIDLSGRLVTLQAAQVQLQKIMNSAIKVDDVLAVHTELTRIQGEIESLQGQIKYYDEAAAYSSIQIELVPPTPGPVETQAAGWNPATTAESAFGALLSVLRFGGDLLIALAVFLGPLLGVGGLLWLLYRASRRRIRVG